MFTNANPFPNKPLSKSSIFDPKSYRTLNQVEPPFKAKSRVFSFSENLSSIIMECANDYEVTRGNLDLTLFPGPLPCYNADAKGRSWKQIWSLDRICLELHYGAVLKNSIQIWRSFKVSIFTPNKNLNINNDIRGHLYGTELP